MTERDDELAAAYEREVGKPPENRFSGDPDWTYRGTKTEREQLRKRIEDLDRIEQASLFDE